MLKNYFLMVFRHFKQKPVIGLINIIGLSLSFIAIIVLSIYCYSELTVDSNNKNLENTFLISTFTNEMHIHTPAILNDQINNSVPGVKESARIGSAWGKPVFQIKNNQPLESSLIFVDPAFFKIFTYPILEGSLTDTFNNPMSLVLIESEAKRLFGKRSAIGQTVNLNNKHILSVTAVIQDPPISSTLQIKTIVPMSSRKIIQPNKEEFTNWGYGNFQTFVLLKDKNNVKTSSNGISRLYPENIKKGKVVLLPFKGLYFRSDINYTPDYFRFGSKSNVFILLMVAFIILIIAIFNYINLFYSQLYDRSKQSGISKILGATKSKIFWNIAFESWLFFIFSFFLSLGILSILMIFINNYTGIYFNISLISNPYFLALALISISILSFISVIFPAVSILKISPLDSLNKVFLKKIKKISFRSILVVIQFSISILLIAFTILVQKQVHFGASNSGFDKENVVTIKLTPQLKKKRQILKDTLLTQTGIDNVGFSQYFPGNFVSEQSADLSHNNQKFNAKYNFFRAEKDFLEIVGLELVDGRFFDNDKNKSEILVNESFLKKYPIPDPLRTDIKIWDKSYKIAGIIKDFKFKSFSSPITPLVVSKRKYFSYSYIKINSSNFNDFDRIIGKIKTVAKDLSPNFPVQINFFNTAINGLYTNEIRFRRIFFLFSFIAIVISCLGILGLTVFSCQQRIKEIGIRKVLGASSFNVIKMLTRDFIKWVIIANIISLPLTYYVMNQWLKNFAYKTEINLWIFMVTIFFSVTISILSVSYHSIKTARAKPIDSLRYE